MPCTRGFDHANDMQVALIADEGPSAALQLLSHQVTRRNEAPRCSRQTDGVLLHVGGHVTFPHRSLRTDDVNDDRGQACLYV